MATFGSRAPGDRHQEAGGEAARDSTEGLRPPGSTAAVDIRMAVAEVEAQAEAGAAFSARMNREGSFVFAPAYWANESSGGAGLAGLADFDDCDSHAPEMRTSMDLPAGIHSGNVPVDAIDLMWGGRGLGSGLAGSAEEIEAFTAIANSVIRRAVDPELEEEDLDEEGLTVPLMSMDGGRRSRRDRTPPMTPRRNRSRTPPPRHLSRRSSRPISEISAPSSTHRRPSKSKTWWVWAAYLSAVVAYLVAAVVHDARGAIPLLACAGAVVFFVGGKWAWRRCKGRNENAASRAATRNRSGIESPLAEEGGLGETMRLLQVVGAIGVLIVAITTFVMLDILPSIHTEWERLVSLGGLVCFILLCLVLSDAPKAVVWRPVFWGLLTQFSIAFMLLKWSAGFNALSTMGDAVMKFLSFAEEGAEFIYGENYQEHYFAFVVLSIIVFFGSFLGVCYHLGIVQFIIDNMSYLMSISFQVSGVDATTAVGNMFVGPCESALLVKPYLYDLTRSELQSLMIAGMGSVSGGSLAAYISYGIPIDHVLVAVMLSAPASIMVAKVLCPEREVSKAASVCCPPGECTNVIEAAAQGAADCIPLVLNIGGIMLAFVSLLALLDAFLGYLGTFVGLDNLSFNFLCSYFFRPFAFLAGVPWKDCSLIAELLGTRCFLNEFVAYQAMGEHMKAGLLEDRSIMLGTYALCGFSNMATVGVLLGGLSPLIPHRSQEIAGMAFRALVGGTMTCLITASVAGFVVYSV